MLSETVIEPNKHEVSEQVMHGSFVAGDSIGRAKLRLLPSGRYRITLKGSDAKGRSVSEQTEFILFGKGDKKPPVASYMAGRRKPFVYREKESRIYFWNIP